MNKTAEPSPNGTTVDHRSRRGVCGFTLIELLVVMAIILILASITFGITRGVQGAQARAKAQGELAVLAQALESFKLRYGDYPHITANPANAASRNASSHELLKALTGWRGIGSGNFSAAQKKESLLDVSRFSLSAVWPPLGAITETLPGTTVFFNDPWGNAYVYLYKNPSSPGAWERFGYMLFSIGPNGRFNSTGFVPASGIFTDINAFRNHPDNRDIIFAGE
jgi:prepilin-type N-terminal cleavage/methylation domain-containing protein